MEERMYNTIAKYEKAILKTRDNIDIFYYTCIINACKKFLNL